MIIIIICFFSPFPIQISVSKALCPVVCCDLRNKLPESYAISQIGQRKKLKLRLEKKLMRLVGSIGNLIGVQSATESVLYLIRTAKFLHGSTKFDIIV